MNDIITQTFEDIEIRMLMLDNEPWWIAVDVCRALELSNTTWALKSLDDDEKSTFRITKGTDGNPNFKIVSI